MRRALAQRLRDERGFTLIEMLTSIAVLGLLFAMFATVLSTTITQGTQEQETTVLQAEARAAIERFAQELRQSYSDDGTWPIQSVSTATNTIRFLSPDRLQPFHLRQIEWRLSGGELQRRSVTSTDTDGDPWVFPTALTAVAWTTEAGSIRNATVFQFLDESGAATSTADDVRKVTITLDVSTVGQAGRVSTYETSVTPRVSVT
jgi:prepilin-type N-terminal cleavage/methylation domain-containing protein